jgi:hypothetical protein
MNHYSSNSAAADVSLQPLSLPQPSSASTNLEASLTSLLTFVCSKTEWEYGESWIPHPTHSILELSAAWCVDPDLDMGQVMSWMQFQVCSKAFTLRLGEGMPGRVWQSQESEWIDDVSAQSETYFLRHQIAKALNVKAAFGVPILINSQVLAVIVFFMSKARPLDRSLIELTQSAIAQGFQGTLLSV